MKYETEIVIIRNTIYQHLQDAGWVLTNQKPHEYSGSGFIASFSRLFGFTSQSVVASSSSIQSPKGERDLSSIIDFHQQVYCDDEKKEYAKQVRNNLNAFLEQVFLSKSAEAIYGVCFESLNENNSFAIMVAGAVLSLIHVELKDAENISVDGDVIEDAGMNIKKSMNKNRINVAILILQEITGKLICNEEHTFQQRLYGINKEKYQGDDEKYQLVEKNIAYDRAATKSFGLNRGGF